MKSITQEDLLGCAIACVAFVTRNDYNKSAKFFNQKNASRKGFYCKDVVSALRKAGLYYDYCYAKPSKKHLSKLENAIVFIKKSKKYPLGHYLVFSKNNWMNPWINFPKIKPAKSGFSKKIPGKIQWIIYPVYK